MTAQTCRRRIAGRDWGYALILSILAAFPRLYRLDLAEFKLDEASHYRMAYSLTRGAWRWVGSTSSAGLPKPPLFVYALALPMAVSRDPRVVTGFLGVLAALATALFYLVLRRFMGKRAAFGGALLFALNPQAVLYARKLFTADLLPPLCTLFLVTGVTFLEASRRYVRRLAMLTTFTFALLVLNTFSSLLLLPSLGLVFLERRNELSRRQWLEAGAVLVLPFVPYLIAVIPGIPAVLADTEKALLSPARPPVLSWIWGLLYGSPWPAKLLSVEGITAPSLAILSLIGLLLLLNKARNREKGRWARFLVTWLCLCPLLMFVMPVEMHGHYLVVLYPLLFVLPAAGAEFAARRASTLGSGALLLLGVTAIWQVQVVVDTVHAGAMGLEWYGTPLGYWWGAAQQARALAEQHGAAEVLVLVPDDHLWSEKANALDALFSDTPHRVVNGQTTIVYPPQPAILMITSEVEASARLAFPCTEDLKADLTASPLGGTYHFRLWSPARGDAFLCTQGLLPATAEWASGVRLLGYGVTGKIQAGASLHVKLLWKTTQGPLDIDIHWFNHLEDQAGRRWGQFDLVGFPAVHWQPGDRVVMHFDLPIVPEAEPGPYILRVGQYTYPEIENVPVVDVAGKPVAYGVTLPVSAQSD